MLTKTGDPSLSTTSGPPESPLQGLDAPLVPKQMLESWTNQNVSRHSSLLITFALP